MHRTVIFLRPLFGENFWETKAYVKYGIPSIHLSDGPNGLHKQERGSGADMLG